MKLTDLSIDCLESILEHLELGDLSNAATSNKRLHQAANSIFGRKHSEKLFHFHNIKLYVGQQIKYRGYVAMNKWKDNLKLIRCFGHLISDIDLLPKRPKSKSLQHVLTYINEYCSDSLIIIKISYAILKWQDFRKPFSNVQIVDLTDCNIVDKDTLTRLFPKMQDLRYTIKRNDKSFFDNTNHFSELKSLHIYNCSMLRGYTMAAVLRLNPQLEKIRIITGGFPLKSTIFQNSLKSMKNLRELRFKGNLNAIDTVICLKNLKYLDSETSGQKVNIPFLFPQITTLRMKTWYPLEFEFFSFIDKHPTIQELSLIAPNLNENQMIKIAKSLKSLKKLTVGIDHKGVGIRDHAYKITYNQADQFMSEFESLESFEFCRPTLDGYHKFQADLNNEWECTISKRNVTVKRLRSSTKKRKVL